MLGRCAGRAVRARPPRSRERQALRPTPGVWALQSPTLIHKRDGWWLHLPFEKRVEIKGRAGDRRLAEPDLKVGTIDLNADSAAAAAWKGPRCLGTRTIWHARENAKREKVLQKVARRQRRSGRPIKGQRSNAGLWRYIAGLDAAVAWRVAAASIAWAVAGGLQRSWCSSTCGRTGPSAACPGVGGRSASAPAGCAARCWRM